MTTVDTARNDSFSNVDANLLHQSTVTLEGMPKGERVAKLQSDNRTARKPFQWRFLFAAILGIYWGRADFAIDLFAVALSI